jgi:Flp pilus assembly pilin Flp
MPLNHFLRDQRGAVMVEVTIMLSLTLVLVLGAIDFLLLFYQWNAAAKAVQMGARLAAVSDPVASGLNGLSHAVVSASVPPGAAMPKFIVTCDGRTATCTCDSVRACRGVKSYDRAAMNTIVFGRGSSSCSDAKSADQVGMCDIFSRITPANVKIVYAQTGLGYAGRPGGPMPTITVSIQNLPFQFYFLGGLIGFRNLQVPASTTSITAEDLSSRAPTF